MDVSKIFLSYSWKNESIADEIYDYLKEKDDIELHRDKIDIGKWESIKEYMNSIADMDYVILLISDEYLKSPNCMYEILEVMRDREYRNKIFPAVINNAIYDPLTRVGYVKYWQNKFKELDNELKEIEMQNLGRLNSDLKRYQDISANIAEFLDVVADMNNPYILEVAVSIEEILKDKGLLEKKNNYPKKDVLKKIRIECRNAEPTDFEIDRYVKECFTEINLLLSEVCEQYEEENKDLNVSIDKIDIRTVVYKFYISGKLVKGVKVFLSNMLSRRESIGISDCTMSFSSSNNSFNGMYNAKVVEGELKLESTMSIYSYGKIMTTEDVVADIWKYNIENYLK